MDMTGGYQKGMFYWTKSPRPEGVEAVEISPEHSYDDQRVLSPLGETHRSILRCSVQEIIDGVNNGTLVPIQRCNCENSSCNHLPSECSEPANPYLRVIWLGPLCPACINQYPESDHIPICSQCGEKAQEGGKYCRGDDCKQYPSGVFDRPSCTTCHDDGFHSHDCPDCGA